ncbi:MAG TPA: DUF5925 domain-containing protein [Solirubrobacteraceae bacterium]|nr:DUF5925 domain-containing protein [Solirubrobacteraceae bacterium]
MEPTMNNTRTDLNLPAAGRRRPHGLRPQVLPQSLFVGEVMQRGLKHVARDRFRGASTVAQLEEISEPLLIRTDAAAAEVEALVRLPGGALALIDTGYSQVEIEVAAETGETARAGASMLRGALEAEPTEPDRISVAFWMRGHAGGEVRHRDIDAPALNEIAENYSAPVLAGLERLAAMRAPERGRLILWRGDPGTGKSHALRALARAWASWCSAHFILDPDELLGHGGHYILDVLTWEDEDDARWRLLILEDAGELIAADARALAGQALSRLLNVTDGILGQGTRTLLLITTNEPVKRLHAAARRPGRCLADIEFTPLAVEEANAWLAARGQERRVEQPTPLAELFGQVGAGPVEAEAKANAFGFARALGE